MSMHKIALTDLEREGLHKHGLCIGIPSQLSDVFRHGMSWALNNKVDVGSTQVTGSNEQKLIDIMFEIAQTAAEHMHGKSQQQICEWTAEQLKNCGFPTTVCGSSWGVLIK